MLHRYINRWKPFSKHLFDQQNPGVMMLPNFQDRRPASSSGETWTWPRWSPDRLAASGLDFLQGWQPTLGMGAWCSGGNFAPLALVISELEAARRSCTDCPDPAKSRRYVHPPNRNQQRDWAQEQHYFNIFTTVKINKMVKRLHEYWVTDQNNLIFKKCIIRWTKIEISVEMFPF